MSAVKVNNDDDDDDVSSSLQPNCCLCVCDSEKVEVWSAGVMS